MTRGKATRGAFATPSRVEDRRLARSPHQGARQGPNYVATVSHPLAPTPFAMERGDVPHIRCPLLRKWRPGEDALLHRAGDVDELLLREVAGDAVDDAVAEPDDGAHLQRRVGKYQCLRAIQGCLTPDVPIDANW